MSETPTISDKYEILTEKAINKIASKGVNGIIFLIALEKTNLSNISIIAVFFSMLGGPVTFFPTVGLVAVANTIKTAIKYCGFEGVLDRVLKKLEAQGIYSGDIVINSDKYPIPKSLKETIENTLKVWAGEKIESEEDE